MRVLLAATLGFALHPQLAGAQRPFATALTPADVRLYARVLAMADARTLDTSVVDRALASRNVSVRAAAALAVGQVGRSAAGPRIARLRATLNDPAPLVASHAAYALGLLRDSSGVAALARALDRQSVALNAAWALGTIGEPARAEIVRRLGNAATSRSTRIQLLLASTKLRPVPLAAILPHLRSSDPSTVWAAAYSIARPTPRAAGGVRALVELAARPAARTSGSARPPPESPFWYDLGASAGPRIRAEIARGLAATAAGDSLGDTAFAILRQLATDLAPHVRVNALRSLATYEARAGAGLVAATGDRDPNVRLAAVQSLALARGVGDVDWVSLWRVDTALAYRGSVLEAALAHGAELRAAAPWATSGVWEYRAALAAVAGSAATPERARTLAVPLTRDADPRVRAAALGALTAQADRITDSVRALAVEALSDSDATVRATAIRAVVRGVRVPDLDRIAGAYEDAARDDDAEARVAALGVLAGAWRDDSSAFAPALRSRISSWRPPPDQVTLTGGRDLPLLDRWKSARATTPPASFYVNIVRRIVVPSLAGARPRATIQTDRGPITLELAGAEAPLTVNNFLTLARAGRYNGLRFHRVVPNFVVQDGDPRGDGSGGPGYAIRDELNPVRYERGALGMALSGPDTGGSQYFITHSPQPHLDGGYTAFGRVVAGLDVLDAIFQGDRITSINVR